MQPQVPPQRNPTRPLITATQRSTAPIAIVYYQTLTKSLISNLATFGLLLLSIYVSQGSAWWTLVTGAIFLSYVVMAVKQYTRSESVLYFYSPEDMQAWLDKQKEPSHDQQARRMMDDAELGRIAMRYVDRAGDHCKEDTAEKICDEFAAEMGDVIDRQCAKRGMPSEKYDTNGNLRKTSGSSEK